MTKWWTSSSWIGRARVDVKALLPTAEPLKLIFSRAKKCTCHITHISYLCRFCNFSTCGFNAYTSIYIFEKALWQVALLSQIYVLGLLNVSPLLGKDEIPHIYSRLFLFFSWKCYFFCHTFSASRFFESWEREGAAAATAGNTMSCLVRTSFTWNYRW